MTQQVIFLLHLCCFFPTLHENLFIVQRCLLLALCILTGGFWCLNMTTFTSTFSCNSIFRNLQLLSSIISNRYILQHALVLLMSLQFQKKISPCHFGLKMRKQMPFWCCFKEKSKNCAWGQPASQCGLLCEFSGKITFLNLPCYRWGIHEMWEENQRLCIKQQQHSQPLSLTDSVKATHTCLVVAKGATVV